MKTRLAQKAVLLFLLELVLIAPGFLPSEHDRGSKSADQYWKETGVEAREVDRLLKSENCYQSQAQFLACVNAISAVAERYQLVLDRNGHLVRMTSEAIEKRLTEKKELVDWSHRLQAGPEVTLNFSFLELWQKLNLEYVKAEEKQAVIGAALNAYLSVTKDPHSYLMPLALYEEVIARSDSRPLHLGFISKRVKGGAFVRKVFDDSPADRAGLKKGDRILELNHLPVTSLHPSQYSEMLKLQVGQRAHLLVERKKSKDQVETREIEILKTDLTYPNVIAKNLEGSHQVGVLTIHKFSRETCSQSRKKLIELQEDGAKGLIVDLRDNPGGQVDEAACVLNLFLPKGQFLFETRYLDPTRPSDRYKTQRDPIYEGPLTVLINGGSASAAEIVAGVLKDLGRAKLVGERSFGKGSFQDGRMWSENDKIVLFETEGLYYFPSGWTPQLIGIEPDLKVGSIEDESFREEDLYYSPIKPMDLWLGPQSLSWIEEASCAPQDFSEKLDDAQVSRAWSLLSCQAGGGHDRHGTL